MNTLALRWLAAGVTLTLVSPGLPAQEAAADSRSRAPIVYAGADSPQKSRTGRAARTVAVSVSDDANDGTGGRRVEFRYPDRPDLAFSAEGVRDLGPQAAPFVFSSSEAAISEQDARAMTTTGAQLAPVTMASLRPNAIDRERAIDFAAPVRVPSGFSPVPEAGFREAGVASWYGPGFEGQPTASGEVFDPMALTGAHPTLPLPSLVEVTNTANGRRIVIRINDRGPFIGGRIVDVSQKVAGLLGFEEAGEAEVELRYIGPAGQSDGSRAVEVRPAPVAAAVPAATRPAQVVASSRTAYDSLGDTRSYYVQTGSFADIGNARTLAERIEAVASVTIVPARVNGADYFRVMAGPVEGKAAAEDLRDQLSRSGIAGGLVRPVE